MRVLHLCPLWFPVASDSPGGIETYLPSLIAALERVGCQSTVVGSAESRTEAELIPAVESNLWEEMDSGRVWEYAPYEQHELLLALELAPEFDVIHSHLGYAGCVLSGVASVRQRIVHTQHNAVTHDLEWFVQRHPDLLMTTVSELQAQKLRRRGATRCRVIPNGIDVASFRFNSSGGRGLVYLGRMEEEKGPDLAVAVARNLGLPLTLAGPMTDDEFFDAEIRPWLGDGIRYAGVADHARKTELLGAAACALMPSRWEEPFGLVALESMACGTPVVALGNGALPDIVEPGVTGYLGDDEHELAELVSSAAQLDRAVVRARVEACFGLERVAACYRELYEEIVDGRT